MATVAGLFERTEDVNTILAGLKEMGLAHGDISIASPPSMDADELQGSYSVAPKAEGQTGKQGMLVTVVAEGDSIERVRILLLESGAANVDVRYNVWERGTVDDYIVTTDQQRDKRSGLENRQE